MTTAMKCNSGAYRVENEDTGEVHIMDNYEELERNYKIFGVLTPSFSLTWVVERKD